MNKMIKNDPIILEYKIKHNFINFKEGNNISVIDILNIPYIQKEIEDNYKHTYNGNISIKDEVGCYILKRNSGLKIKKDLLIKNKDWIYLYNNSLATTNINIVIKYLYLEFYLIIENYKNKNISIEELKQNILGFLNIKRKKYSLNTNKNRDLLITNSSAYELPRDGNKFKKYETIMKNMGINFIEVPKNFKRREFYLFLYSLSNMLDKLGIKKINVNIRFKRIKQYKKIGMFIKNANTIIIDPREPKAIIHELGHYIYENNLPFNLNGKRIYKGDFKKIIKKNKLPAEIKKNKKYEDYEIESEIFAYWFEKLYK